jgi:hypothetical protein
MFFDATNAARAAAGLPALGWREDVAAMATSHSVDMMNQGGIFHGSFVSEATLRALNAHTIGENVGMGGDELTIQDAFMASPHHRDNILDSGFNQVGIGVVTNGGSFFVTEDFLQAKGGPVSARPKPAPVSHPATSLVVAPRRVTHAGSAPKPVAVAAATAPAPALAADAPTGVVTPVAPESDGAKESAPVKMASPSTARGAGSLSAWWAALLGALVLMGSAGGHFGVRKARRKA